MFCLLYSRKGQNFKIFFFISLTSQTLLKGQKYIFPESEMSMSFNGPIIFVSNELHDSLDNALSYLLVPWNRTGKRFGNVYRK